MQLIVYVICHKNKNIQKYNYIFNQKRSLINWFNPKDNKDNKQDNKDIKLNIITSSTTRSVKSPEPYMPQLVFVNGFNSKYEIGFDTFKHNIGPILSYFSKI